MESLLSKLDKVKKIEDPRIRQSLTSDVAEKAILGSGGVSAFLGTQDLPPEAYGTDYTNLPNQYRKVIQEVADMDLKSLRTVKGQQTITRALARQNVSPNDAAKFLKSLREASEVWLGKDSREFMKKVAGVDAPNKIGHIGDLLKTNAQGVSKSSTLWRFIKSGLRTGVRGMGTAGKIGTGALLGGAIVKLLQSGVEEERPPERKFKAIESIEEGQVSGQKPVESIDDIIKQMEAIKR